VARYAMEFPEHIERLVMVCGPPIRCPPHSDTMNQIMADRLNTVAPGFLQELLSTNSPEREKLQRFWDLLKQTRAGRQPLRPMKGEPSKYANEQPEKVSAVFNRAMQTQGDWDWREDASG
jgi:hypothetical protein